MLMRIVFAKQKVAVFKFLGEETSIHFESGYCLVKAKSTCAGHIGFVVSEIVLRVKRPGDPPFFFFFKKKKMPTCGLKSVAFGFPVLAQNF